MNGSGPAEQYMVVIDIRLCPAGYRCWTISALSAGGGSILTVAAIAVTLGRHAVVPASTFAGFLVASALTSAAACREFGV